MTVRNTPAVACALAAFLSLSACAGDGPISSDSSSMFSQLQSDIFDQNCTTAGCHNPQSAAAGMILTDGFSFDSLVGVAPTNATAHAAGMIRVQPFAPDNSFLLKKITSPGPGQGSRMPLGAEPLSDDQIRAIRTWIEAGASQFAPAPGEPTAVPTPTIIADSPTATAAPPTDTPSAAATATETPTELVAATNTPVSGATPTPTQPITTNTPTEATVPTVSLEQVQEQIFTPKCATPFCHSGANPAAQLSLVAGESFDSLVGVVPTTGPAAQEGRLRVDPGNPDNSFILIKVMGPPAGQGSRMPLVGDPLTADQIELLRAWITGL